VRNQIRACVFIFAVLLYIAPQSWSQLLYATNEVSAQLLEVNMSTGVVTTLFSNIGANPDSLLVDSRGRIIYTVEKSGDVDIYDPSTGLNSVLATGFLYPRDLVFDPGGATLLVSNYEKGEIDRINMTTGAWTPLLTKQKTVDGMAYDSQGNLFANVKQHTQIVQINPTTGAILKTLTVVTNQARAYYGLDGLTYDPYTGELWATDVGTGANCLVEIPTNLSGFTLVQVGNMVTPDGLISDGLGNIYLSVNLSRVYEYNIPTNTITKEVRVTGVDDVAFVPAN
jgi:glucose/arabinose dehydrogenase